MSSNKGRCTRPLNPIEPIEIYIDEDGEEIIEGIDQNSPSQSWVKSLIHVDILNNFQSSFLTFSDNLTTTVHCFCSKLEINKSGW